MRRLLRPVCYFRRHRWESVPSWDAKHCQRCDLTLTALQVIERWHEAHAIGELIAGKRPSAQGILLGGWPPYGSGRSIYDWNTK